MSGSMGDVRTGNTPERAPDGEERSWDDGLIARRSRPPTRAADPPPPAPGGPAPGPADVER
ncbi:hypothetical protein, partial [Streptomyces sparsus]